MIVFIANLWSHLTVYFIDIREKEKKFLEATAYVQSASVALTPVVPIIAVIVTFLAHIGFGYDLSPAEVCLLFLYLFDIFGIDNLHVCEMLFIY